MTHSNKIQIPETIYSCPATAIPHEFWQIKYSDGLHEECPNLKLPGDIGHIDFAELIERLDQEDECYASNQLYELQANSEQGLACVRLVAWLLKNGRL